MSYFDYFTGLTFTCFLLYELFARFQVEEACHSFFYRYYTMLYFPSGFWSRLISRLISDEKFWRDLRGYYSEEGKSGLAVEWLCWQNALELRFGNNPVLKLKELAEYNNRLPEKVMINHDANWRTLSLHNKAIMEIKLPLYSKGDIVVSSVASVSMLLNRCVSHIDALLEDW